jgi:hypothetical protein
MKLLYDYSEQLSYPEHWLPATSPCRQTVNFIYKHKIRVSKHTKADGVIPRYIVISVLFSGYCQLQMLQHNTEASCKPRFVFDALKCTTTEDEDDYAT